MRAPRAHDSVRRVLALALATLAATSTTPPTSAEVPRLLVLDLTAGKGIEKDTAATFTEFLTAYLSESTKLVVVSKRDIARLADLEADKQQQGCDNSDACMAEIGGALGARYVVFGRMSKLGETSFVHVTLVDSTSGQPLARRVVNAPTLEKLAIELKRATIELASSIGTARRPNTTFGPPPTTTTSTTTDAKPSTPLVDRAPVTPRVTHDDDATEHRVPDEVFDEAPTPTVSESENRKELGAKLRDESASKIAIGAGVIAGGVVVGAGATGLATLLFIRSTSLGGIPIVVCIGCGLANLGTIAYGATVISDGVDLGDQAERVEHPGKRVAMAF